MTITAPGLGAPGLASPGIGLQQGPGPAFPTPIGAEQFFGTGQPYGSQPSFWPQAPHGMQDPYGRPAAGHVMPQEVQQLVGQLTVQILPVAEQIVLPRVIAIAVQLVQQQVQQQVQQLMAHMSVPQTTGQYPGPAPQWQQPFWGQQPSGFGQPVRSYPGLS